MTLLTNGSRISNLRRRSKQILRRVFHKKPRHTPIRMDIFQPKDHTQGNNFPSLSNETDGNGGLSLIPSPPANPYGDRTPSEGFSKLNQELKKSYDDDNLQLADLGLQYKDKSIRDKAFQSDDINALGDLAIRSRERNVLPLNDPESLGLVSIIEPSDPALQPKRMQHDELRKEPACAVEKDSMGDWPARLLHIPTMTSVPWKPGNLYNHHREPRYATISYTWGRWRLPSDRSPPAPALSVYGTTWNIPAVDKALFTADQFEHVLRKIAADVDVSFVWVDIACIDQNDGSAEGAREIGRQAKIFGNSCQTYIWLVSCQENAETFSVETLLQNFEAVSALLAPVYHQLLDEYSDLDNRTRTRKKLADYYSAGGSADRLIINASVYINSLASIPWFSSLWTLQEAFLQPSARFLDVNGHCPRSSGNQPIVLQDVLWWCKTLYQLCILQDNPTPLNDIEESDIMMKKAAMTIIKRSGLEALAERDRMALYTYARVRQTSRPVDRIYGIMQIWDFQLGVAAPGANPNREWSQLELELQLGEKLLEEFPIESQLQVHTSLIEGRQSWRISGYSAVPPHELSMSQSGHLGGLVERRYLHLDHRRINDTTYGFFEGKVCSFESLRQSWADADDNGGFKTKALKETIAHGPMWFALDATAVLNETTLQIPYPLENIPPGKQLEIAGRISAMARHLGRNFSVLLLATVTPRFTYIKNNKATAIGLLVMDAPDPTIGRWWKRLGICLWTTWAQTPTPTPPPVNIREKKDGVTRDDVLQLMGQTEATAAVAVGVLSSVVEPRDWHWDQGVFG